MITLNLIPQEQKTALHNTRLYEALKEAITLVFLFASIIAILLWLSRYYLEKELADLMIENSVYIRSNEDTNQKINLINSKITSISNIQSNFVSNRQLIENLALIAPANVSYSQLKFYRQQNLAEISGVALTRDDLLNFKKQLEKTAWIKSIDLPMSSLIDKENNNFSIRLEINPKTLPLL